MFRTAVIALDLSRAAEALLGCVGEWRRWGVTRFVIAHVVRVGYGQQPGERALREIVDWLESRSAPLRASGSRLEVVVRSAASPAEGILDLAAQAEADLVVVGTRGHNLASRLFLGSVARDVVRRTERPLLLEWLEPTADGAGAHCAPVCADTLRHVLLTTDLSKQAGAAERAAVALAGIAARVDALAVLTPEAVAATPALPLMARAALDELLARVRAGGGQGEALVRQGDPHELIVQTAQERDASLIVCGKRGENWVHSRVIGSTASRLCEHAGRSVLLVPLAGGR